MPGRGDTEDLAAVVGALRAAGPAGARTVARRLGWGVGRAARTLRLAHRYLLVLRARDPLGRRRYRAYRANPVAPGDPGGVEEWIRGFEELRQVREGLVPGYRMFDARLDEYFITATSALCMVGECWNLVGIPSVMVAVSLRGAEEARRLAGRLTEVTGTQYYVLVKDVERCEYELEESLAVNLATPIQAMIDALANRDKPGVDYYETLTTFAGNYLLDWALEPGQPMLRKLRRMVETQYPDRLGKVLSPPYYMYMLLLSFTGSNGDEFSLAFARAMEVLRPPRLENYDTIIYEAMRGSLLGNKVAAYLGLEPLVAQRSRRPAT